MELLEATERARHLTGDLLAALDRQDMEAWFGLLDRRAEAMMAFEAAHRGATDTDHEACREAMAALQAEDRNLRAQAESLLEILAGEFRGQLGSSTGGMNRYAAPGHQACLDRKA